MEYGADRKEQAMARYRTYKNGITGCRYKGSYIIKGERKGEFSILAEDGSLLRSGLYDFADCQWEIDKASAGEKERARMEELYAKQIYELTAILARLKDKNAAGELTDGEAELLLITDTIRARKAKDRPF